MDRRKERAGLYKEMATVLEIMEIKGFMVESDHSYAYSMQHRGDFNDVSEWLVKNGYEGSLDTAGYFDYNAGAVYGLFVNNRLSHAEMHKELIKESK